MNILKINGQTLTGIYVDAAVSFNKPAKRVQTFEVPGRNGNLIIDEGTFDNVLISYPVYEKDTFPAEFDDLVNWLASLEGYQRIECSNDPDHYRMGRFVVPQTPTAERLNRDGYYQLSFDCKPQRWLLSGDEDTEVDANPQETYEGEIVSFEAEPLDVISDLKVDIEPVQNLNGQPNPYPGGGGKNLIPNKHIGTSPITRNGVTITFNADGSIKFAGTASDVVDIILWDDTIAIPAGNYASLLFDTNIGVTLQLRIESFAGADVAGSATYTSRVFTTTETKNIVGRIRIPNGTAFGSSGVTCYPMLAVSTVALTSADFAPYSNICPISGWTGAEEYVRGTNVWDEEWELGYLNANTGANANSNNCIRSKNYIAVKPSTSYYVKGIAQLAIFYYDKDKTYITKEFRQNTVINVPDTCAYIRFYMPDAYGTTYNHDISINYPSTDHDYHAYNGATYEVDWQTEVGTVYKGYINPITGVLTVTHIGATFTSAEYYGTYGVDNAPLFYADLTSNVKIYADSGYPAANKPIANYYVAINKSNSNALMNGQIRTQLASTSTKRIYWRDDRYSSKAEMDAWLSSNPLQVVCPLATPLTYQLTPTEVELLLGTNNIWGNTGDISVTVTTPSNFINPGNFPSRPLLRIYGTGTVRINDVYITIAAHTQPYIDIDCEMQECYYEDTNMNEYVTFSDGEYPELEPGNNYVLLGSGITRIDVTPRWWEL